MRLRRRLIKGKSVAEIQVGNSWRCLTNVKEVDAILPVGTADDLLPYLQLEESDKAELMSLAASLPTSDDSDGQPLLPVLPRSFRDFMLYEDHVINASRGMVRHTMPGMLPITQMFEAITRKPFPKFKPHKLWYQQPIYYLSNHQNLLTDGDTLPWPAYTDLLDYELELGAILARPLYDATPQQAADAIGGFVVINDLSARDVQLDEMRSGFGPQRSKHFASAISAEIISADEVLPKLGELTGKVMINGKQVATVSDKGGQFTLPEAIAAASVSTLLNPGELFGTGTLPGGAGLENDALISAGDTLSLEIDGIATLTGIVGRKGAAR